MKEGKGYGFGTFKGVFTPSILTIIGVVMYLRFGWVLGNVGLASSLAILTASSLITFFTGLSISSLATNMRIKGGGAYYMLSRSFGVEAGAAIGIPLFLSQAIAVAFYTAGFVEAFRGAILAAGQWDSRIVGFAALAAISLVTLYSADLALKTQYAIMALIGLSVLSFALGRAPDAAAIKFADAESLDIKGFWPVLAVFFPAVTGILSGLGMSGDLRSPGRSLPLGTISAVATGYLVYAFVVIMLERFSRGLGEDAAAALIGDEMFFMKCARWPALVVAGVWSACLSSAVGSILAAPRVLQALAKDGAAPRLFGRSFGANDEPRHASLLTIAIAAAIIAIGDINAIAGVLTMFNLTVYCLLNLSAGLEEIMGNPSWRPKFRVHAAFSFAGFALCLAMMFMISAGSTIIAFSAIALIFWIMHRRSMRARWGDMRYGLLMTVARLAMRGLSSKQGDARNWRPNLLVLAGAPTKRPHLVGLAGAISQNRSLMTVASVIPEGAWSVERAESLRSASRAYLDERGIEAQVRIHPGESVASGICELIRSYGWGPLVPNTILMGNSRKEESLLSHAEILRLLSLRKRNALIVGDNDIPSRGGKDSFVDIWWRGKSANASFMLAIAYLLRRGGDAEHQKLRICHLSESKDRVQEDTRLVSEFISRSRVDAVACVLPPEEGLSPVETICKVSGASSCVFLGLRPPGEGESNAAYAAYLDFYERSTSSMPFVVFALAGEEVDFNAIFN